MKLAIRWWKSIPVLFFTFSGAVMLLTPVALAQDAGAEFTEGPSLNVPRVGPRSAVLPGGRLAVFGGIGEGWWPLDTAEIYDPGTDSFTRLTMNSVRQDFALARLADGRILLAGGVSDGWGVGRTAAAEIFDPASSTFTPTGSLNATRALCTAATLTDGRALVVGTWYDETSNALAEVYDPATEIFTPTGPLDQPRALSVVLPTADGGAVVAGGYDTYGTRNLEEVEHYDPATNSFTLLQSTIFPEEPGWMVNRGHYPLPIEEQRLSDGRYLLFAWNPSAGVQSWVTFDPATKQFSRLSTTAPAANS